MLNFDFLEKGLGIVSPSDFGYDFLDKLFSYYILLTDPILLYDCFYVLRCRAICVLQLFFLVFDVINFEITPIFQKV